MWVVKNTIFRQGEMAKIDQNCPKMAKNLDLLLYNPTQYRSFANENDGTSDE